MTCDNVEVPPSPKSHDRLPVWLLMYSELDQKLTAKPGEEAELNWALGTMQGTFTAVWTQEYPHS